MDYAFIQGGRIEVVPSDPNVRVMTVHESSECKGRTCIIHSPTGHHMREWTLFWRADRSLFERICPHGAGHPDPDQEAYWRELAEQQQVRDIYYGKVDVSDPDQVVETIMSHTCDGCCGV